jgi:hypothetical protein
MSQVFDFGTRIGLLLIVESASVSAIAVTGFLLYVGVRDIFLSTIEFSWIQFFGFS